MRRLLLSLAACFPCISYAASTTAKLPGPAVGSVAPDFKAHNSVTGATIPLISQRGKVVILTFWASWCGPCIRELPILENAQRFLGKDKLTVFAVSFKENPQAADALKKAAANWQINVIEDRNGWIASRYAISSIPHLFIIDRDGKVAANHLGYGDRTVEELVADINQALSESPPVEPEVTPPPTGST
jgi:thiol-disulfide isomerase/thioredoxin